MTDYIAGKVRRIIDSRSFEVKVDFREKKNSDIYLDNEVVRLADYRMPILGRDRKKVDHRTLRHRVWNRYVVLRVIGRDDDDKVIAHISRVTM